MKSFKYIWRNVTRNKVRSILTILSVCFSLGLLTILHGYMAMRSTWSDEAAKNNRVVVMNIQGFSGALPIAVVDRVRRVDGVTAVVPRTWFGGEYMEERMPFAQFATDPKEAFDVYSEYEIDPGQLNDWQNDRQGCVADRQLAEKRKWNIGDRIPLQGTLYPVNLELRLCGVFEASRETNQLWFHWEYLDEGRKQMNSFGTGNAGTVYAKAENAAAIPGIIEAIDSRFASSENPTRTQTEAAFAQMFTDMLGNIQAYILYIGLAVVFSLSLVAANAMAMSMRERTTEVAVLKAIGFPRARVLRMILGESMLISLLGGILGISLGCFFLELLHGMNPQLFQVGLADMVGPWLLYMLAVAAGNRSC